MNKLFCLFYPRRFIDRKSFSNRLTADGKVIPKVKNDAPRITLIGPDESILITDLQNAKNISLRRDLKLVKIQDIDAKTRRPLYKLMTSAEYHQEELSSRKLKQENKQNAPKREKLLTFTTKIGEHDLMTNVKKMMKLLEKQYEVRVVIAGDVEGNGQKSDSMYTIIEKNVKDLGKVVQKRIKGNSLRFQLLPLNSKSVDADAGSNLGSNDNNNDKGPL